MNPRERVGSRRSGHAGLLPTDPRFVSLTATGSDGIVFEPQLTGPADCLADVLRGRLDAAVRHAVSVFESGVPVDAAVGDVWLSGRVVE